MGRAAKPMSENSVSPASRTLRQRPHSGPAPPLDEPPLLLPLPVPAPMPADAVTVASTEVWRTVAEIPAPSVTTELALSVPAVVVKMTGTPDSALPLTSVTAAVMVVVAIGLK